MSKPYRITIRLEAIRFASYTEELCWLDGIADNAPGPVQVPLFDHADITLDGASIDQGEHDESKHDLLHWYLKQKEYGQACVELTYQGYGVKVARFFRAAVPSHLKDHERRDRRRVTGTPGDTTTLRPPLVSSEESRAASS